MPPSNIKVNEMPSISDIAPNSSAPIAPPPIATIVHKLITLPLNSSVSWSCAADCIVVAKKVAAHPSKAIRLAVTKISREKPKKIIEIGTSIEESTPRNPTVPASCGLPVAFAKDANIAPPPALAVRRPKTSGPLSKTPWAIMGRVSSKPRPTAVTQIVNPNIYKINGSLFVCEMPSLSALKKC